MIRLKKSIFYLTFTITVLLVIINGFNYEIAIVTGFFQLDLYHSENMSSHISLLPGGIMNYSATATVGADVLNLQVRMNGLTSDGMFNEVLVSINGNLPTNALGATIVFNDYTADYKKVKTGKFTK